MNRNTLQYEARLGRRPARVPWWPHTVASLFAVATLAANVLVASALAARVWDNYPENHWGSDIRFLWGWCAAVILACGGLWFPCRNSRWWLLGAIVSAGALAALVVFLDTHNLLVEYEVWLRRDMPSPS